MKKKFIFIVLAFIAITTFYCEAKLESKESVKQKTNNSIYKISITGLLADGDDELLLISTLDGALHAVTKATGIKRWTLKDEPVIQNPTNSDNPPVPQFFPNPQDGSLYRYTAGRGREPLKKLPFTIPELVANSPSRSNDGIFYIGKKVDTWVGVDSITGKTQLVMGVDAVEKVCPKQSQNTIYLGRTLYNVVLFELNTGHKWNVSFYHYTTTSAGTELKNYDLVHYTATGEGSVLTVDQKTGVPIWNMGFDSPVVAMYILDTESVLTSVPFTTVTSHTLQRLSCSLKEFSNVDGDENSGDLLIKELSPTIFLGESPSGVYALPAFVDTSTARISRRQTQLLLDGPPGQRATLGKADELPKKDDKDASDVLLLGYYDLPESLKTELKKATMNEIRALNEASLPIGITHQGNTSTLLPTDPEFKKKSDNVHQHVFWYGIRQFTGVNTTFIFSRDSSKWVLSIMSLSGAWLTSDPLNFMVAALIAGFCVIIVLLYQQAQGYARLNREMSSRRVNSSKGSTGTASGDEITAVAEELDDGAIRVGKISFDPKILLGKGCDGTFVFRGSFDGRSVAVKRVLPGCFSIADREVDLLRESDQHPNVIRYFCMEQCREFRYIALELCLATLEDFVHSRIQTDIPALVLLRQATAGLHHLHSLDIVHRDIKPHNVLISHPSSKGEVRAVISDFGLCKRLEVGRMSFSKKSGVTGTEGWIAPEMINTGRPTSKVDIFSLGCVYYYVLSKGKHPFGKVLDRQSNILNGRYNLEELSSEDQCLYRLLIEKMISSVPSKRPPTLAVLRYPLFWPPDKILQFFQEVSDRVEKETGNSPVLMNLEWGNVNVVRSDWTKHMHPIIGEDLRRFRDYNGRSVRDLLRAIRNKKNHHRELPEDAKRVFGRIPEDYVPYWTIRFPLLLLHAWHAMQCCKTEPIFSKYYFEPYDFRLDDVHKTVSLSPNNRRPSPLANLLNRPSKEELDTVRRKPHDDFITLLGPPLPKGPRRPAKHDKGAGPAPWVLRKPENTFEPRFNKPVVNVPECPIVGDTRQVEAVPEEETEVEQSQEEKANVNSTDKTPEEELEEEGNPVAQIRERRKGKKKKKSLEEKINDIIATNP